MLLKLKQILKDERGNSVIIAPLFVLILCSLFLGFVLYTGAYYQKHIMNMAIREGAREYRVKEQIDKAITTIYRELELGMVGGCAVSVDRYKVTVRKDIGFYIPLAKKYLFNLESSAEFSKEEDLHFYRKD